MHLCLLGDANHVHVQRWAREMLARGNRVSIVTARPYHIDGIEQRLLRPVTRSLNWLMRAGEARQHVMDLSPDILHAHYVTSYGYLAARCGRHPLVITAWGSDILVTPRESLPARWLTAWTLRRADLVTGDSQDLVDAIAGYRLPGLVREIHWGADMDRFAPQSWSSKSGFNIVSLRSWEPNYNIDVIVEAFSLLRQRMPSLRAHLHLLGGGSLAGELHAQIQRLGLVNDVTMHGRVDDAAMLTAIQASKVSVSVPTSDATSVSVLESMACGVPVVASDLKANRQWLDASLLVAARNAPALACRLQQLAEDEALCARLGNENFLRMQRDGARSVQMDKMNALYAQLLDALKGRVA